jgi:hypothetical protein
MSWGSNQSRFSLLLSDRHRRGLPSSSSHRPPPWLLRPTSVPTGDTTPQLRPASWAGGHEVQNCSPSTQRQPACRTQAYMSTRDWDMSWSPTR